MYLILLETARRTGVRRKQEYYRVKELLDGKVPTRMELFANMDDNIYEYCMKH